jgi:crotonobetainyl-CoA:carnitine CoA-transferase CaiB-like acyl-CoA transferase
MCAMLLADLGAEVLRIDRIEPAALGVPRPLKYNLTLRGRKSVAIDLKSASGRDTVLKIVGRADALIEGFRPGVAERLGLGPEQCFAHNPRLVYGRITGWGQTGPLANAAGHDLNYIALTGALHAIGRKGQPSTPPLNLVGDFGGGALYLALGILSALLERQKSGKGQVVDAAIVDGTASLMTQFYGMFAAGLWDHERGTNALDSGAPFYDVYTCADGRLISVAPIEHKFLQQLIDLMELPKDSIKLAADKTQWPRLRELFAAAFKQHPLSRWCGLLEGTDTCVAPVLSLDEAPKHPHIKARQTFISIDGVVQPAPAPRFSRSQPDIPSPPQSPKPIDEFDDLSAWLV